MSRGRVPLVSSPSFGSALAAGEAAGLEAGDAGAGAAGLATGAAAA